MVGTPDLRYYLHTHMIMDDDVYPKPLRDWTLVYVLV